MDARQAADLPPGTFLGRYRILGVLGRGGMSVVYHGHDSSLARDVAIKVLNADTEQDRTTVSEVLRTEARLAAQLQHPGIVTVHELLDSPAAAGIVMELVRGRTLAQVLTEPVEPHRAVAIAARVADALTYAHARGIVHCDIKPSNIMLADHGGVKVLDFGLAGLSPALSKMSSDTRAGTLPYMAPEQFKGGAITPATDVFALGAVLYEMLVGEQAFPGADGTSIASSVLNEVPRWLRDPARRFPVELQSVLSRSMEKQPARRFADAGEFRTELLTAWSRSRSWQEAPRATRTAWRRPAIRGGSNLFFTRRPRVGWFQAPRGRQRTAVMLAAALTGTLAVLGGTLAYAIGSPRPSLGVRAPAGGAAGLLPAPSNAGRSWSEERLDQLVLGDVRSGHLPPGGARRYRLSPQVSDALSVAVESADFDTFLRVYQEAGGSLILLGENDDWQGSTSASVVFIPAGSAQRSFVVEVSSYRESGQGRYSVAATSSGLEFAEMSREALRELAMLQEVYYADWQRYTAQLADLGYSPPAGIHVVIPEAGPFGWYAVARHELQGSGRGCALRYGSVSSTVYTPGGRPLREAGHVICD